MAPSVILTVAAGVIQTVASELIQTVEYEDRDIQTVAVDVV